MSDSAPSDDHYVVLSAEELAFLKTQTGIQDEDVLKAHAMAVRKRAYEVGNGLISYVSYAATTTKLQVYNYPCIRRFGFVRSVKIHPNERCSQAVYRFKINKNRAAYEHVLDVGRNVPGAILLDIGCCCACIL